VGGKQCPRQVVQDDQLRQQRGAANLRDRHSRGQAEASANENVYGQAGRSSSEQHAAAAFNAHKEPAAR